MAKRTLDQTINSIHRSREYDRLFGSDRVMMCGTAGTFLGSKSQMLVEMVYYPKVQIYHAFANGYMGHGVSTHLACKSLVENMRRMKAYERKLNCSE